MEDFSRNLEAFEKVAQDYTQGQSILPKGYLVFDQNGWAFIIIGALTQNQGYQRTNVCHWSKDGKRGHRGNHTENIIMYLQALHWDPAHHHCESWPEVWWAM